MLTNLYLAYTECNDINKHIEIDNADILGFNDDIINQCSDRLLDTSSTTVRRNVIVVPRRVIHVDSDSIDKCVTIPKSVLAGCIPLDINSARRLAKVNKILAIVLTTESSRFIDESQVNFMAQSAKPKYIEVHLYPFVARIANQDVEANVEKEFYTLGKVVEYALKRDIGVIPTAASPTLRRTLLTTHIDIILYSLGFSKRERRLMLELYPIDLIQNWLNQ